jgi:hypothetical protein
MSYALELKYGLTSQEPLDAIDKRFRLKVALERAVAEVHFERELRVTRNPFSKSFAARRRSEDSARGTAGRSQQSVGRTIKGMKCPDRSNSSKRRMATPSSVPTSVTHGVSLQ